MAAIIKAQVLERVKAGEKLKTIAASIGIQKPWLSTVLKQYPQYQQAKHEALEVRAKALKNIVQPRERIRHRRYLRRELAPRQGVRFASTGLFRGKCDACGHPESVTARTAPDGGLAECFQCGWQGRTDLYVLRRRSTALHIAYGMEGSKI